MSYTERNQKKLELPSGATCYIRKLIGNDFVPIGHIPAFRSDTTIERKPTEAEVKESVKWGLGLERVILTQCVSGFEYKGEKLRIIDKQFGSAAVGEITLECLDQEDAGAIVNAVINFSGMRKEGAGDGQTFQPDTHGNSELASPRNNIPATAEPVP